VTFLRYSLYETNINILLSRYMQRAVPIVKPNSGSDMVVAICMKNRLLSEIMNLCPK
jgi:hypothetical protein